MQTEGVICCNAENPVQTATLFFIVVLVSLTFTAVALRFESERLGLDGDVDVGGEVFVQLFDYLD